MSEQTQQPKMNLARALRFKKRVVEAIARTERDISANNSKPQGAEREANPRELMDRRESLVKYLLELKLAISRSTQPILPLILQIGENKARIKFLSGIGTTHGFVPASYQGDVAVTYEAIFRKGDLDKQIKSIEAEIDQAQTAIDQYNAVTFIELAEIEL